MSQRNKGTGSIYYRSERKIYEGKIKVGVKYNGKPIYKYVIGKRKTDVQNELIKIRSQLNKGSYCEPAKTSLSKWLNEWLNVYMRASIKEQTYNTYKMVIDKIVGSLIGDVQLKNLTPIMIQHAFNRMADRYAPSTLRKVKSILSMAFRVARQNAMLDKDLLSGLKLPRLQKPRIESLTAEEAKLLLNAAKDSYVYEALAIALGTGLRIGEILALTWNDFDYRNSELTIKKTLVRIKDKFGREVLSVQQTLKTQSSLRTVPLSRSNVSLLRGLKKRRLTEGFADHGIIFCSTKGTHISPRNFNHTLERICERAGIKRISANVTRHTFATLAVERNAEVKVVSEILGHSKIETTYNNYVHPSREKAQEIAEMMTPSAL